MDGNQVGQLFMKELSKLIRMDLPLNEKISHQNDLLMEICQAAINDTGIQFHTTFSIIAYTGHRYNLPGRLLYNVHRFRRDSGKLAKKNDPGDKLTESLYKLGLKVCSDMLRIIYSSVPTAEILGQIPGDQVYLFREDKVVHFKKYQRVLVLKQDEGEENLIAIDQSRPEKPIVIRYNVDGRNEIFNETIALLGGEFKLPIEVNLVDVEIDEQGVYVPKAFVIEPDFLGNRWLIVRSAFPERGFDFPAQPTQRGGMSERLSWVRETLNASPVQVPAQCGWSS